MGEFISFLLVITVPVLGFLGRTWWWVFGAALIGLWGYWMMRPTAFLRFQQESIARRSIWPFTAFVVGQYAAQLLVCALLFLGGRGVGHLF